MFFKNGRPVYLNLFKIKLPLPGFVSILHRVSGVYLFIFSGFLLWILQNTLSSENSYINVKLILDNFFVKLLIFAMIWSFLHHFLAGIRFLLLDFHIGTRLKTTRIASAFILFSGAILTLVIFSFLYDF